MKKQLEINKSTIVQELNTFLEKHVQDDTSICVIFGLILDKDGNYDIFRCEQENRKSYLSPWRIMDAIGPVESEFEAMMFNKIYKRNLDIRNEDCELQLEAYRNLVKKWLI